MSQKFEPLLNLALETPEETRLKTQQLGAGYNTVTDTWELIVKYHDTLDMLTEAGITIEYLIAGYAILTVPAELVESLSFVENIEYVEKPKRYYFAGTHLSSQLTMQQTALSPFSQTDFLEESCIYPVTAREPFLTGNGVLIAVIDSGIDYRRNDFRNPDGTTRILFLWDQTDRQGPPPEGFAQGREYTADQLNEALTANIPLPSIDSSGHGTAVAGIAAATVSPSYEGAAPGSQLLIVKLGLPSEEGFPRTTEIMRAVTYAIRKSLSLGMPLVINLSFGNTYGSHDGSSLLERFLDNAVEIGRSVICVGSGNEGNSAGHARGNLTGSTPAENTVRMTIGEYERNLSVQIWSHYSDRFRLFLRAPSGTTIELPSTIEAGKYTAVLDQTELLIYHGEPSPYSVARELYIEFLPIGSSFLPTGIWEFRAEPLRVTVGYTYFYLPAAAARNEATVFLTPNPQVTLTIPSTASRVITVGAYDSVYSSYADFSGRGYETPGRTIGVVTSGLIKPDLAAPGVNLQAPDLYGGYTNVTGTSFATPIVSGAAALLMEWGIVRGNDPYLYGEKVKAYLRSGARPIRGIPNYPNNRVGFGALCVSESLPSEASAF